MPIRTFFLMIRILQLTGEQKKGRSEKIFYR